MFSLRGVRRPTPLILLAGLAAAPARAAAGGEVDQPPIVVTGQRAPDASPATVESLDAARIDATVNVVNVEDSLRYLPSLFVRKRHIGDTQAPLATRTSGVGASARSLIYADGVLLSALIGNNNSIASPRWGMVSPEEVERIETLYGPFSAAYPGNSIGAVVNLTTRLPEGPEASLHLGVTAGQLRQYDASDAPWAGQVAATWAGRAGRFAWFLSANHVSSESQPLAYVTIARPAGTSLAGIPVSGAFEDVNRIGAPIFVIGAGGIETQAQDTLGLKLAFDVTPSLRLLYRAALFLNDTDARAETWLTGPGGQPLYAGMLNIGGRSVTVPASAFSNNVYRLDERHWMHALSLEGSHGDFDWRAIASLYDFDHDVQRIPSGALPSAAGGGPGSIVRLDGTGWRTFDLTGRWHPAAGGHDISFGGHLDGFRLANDRFATADWRSGAKGPLVQAARGRTRTAALWLQDRWAFAPGLTLTLGGRAEWWRAYDGFNFSLAPALSVDQPELSRSTFSPKASLAWQPAEGWRVTLSAAQAWRFPTVSELYQAVATGPTITIPNPNLRPERARSEELAVERSFGASHIRLSLFNERIRDALISQSAPLLPGSNTLFNFVQNIPEVRTRGVELSFDWRDALIPGLDLAGSATLADPRIVADPILPAAEGKDIPQIPRRRATLAATYHVGARGAVTLAGRYASRSFGTIDNSDLVTHTFQGFEGFVVLDARFTWRLTGHLEAAAGVENVTGTHYYIFHPFPGRTFSTELTWRW